MFKKPFHPLNPPKGGLPEETEGEVSKGLTPQGISLTEDFSSLGDGSYRERIIAYLKIHSPSQIKSIAQGTGIKANAVNLVLHNGDGKIFVHLKEQRAWDLRRDGGR